MKLIGKLTDEEVDVMIPETDVDDIQCSEQIVDVPVPQIAERIVEVVTAFHGSKSQNESSHRSSTCQDTHKVVEKIVKDSQAPAASCERTGSEDCLKARPSSEPVNKSSTQWRWSSPRLPRTPCTERIRSSSRRSIR